MKSEKPTQKRKPNDFWTDENIISELKAIIEDIKHFPSQQDLKKLKRSDLLSAMKKKRGIKVPSASCFIYKSYLPQRSAERDIE